jgi:transcriptional regulator with XRE-family HTH domain
VCIFVRAFYSLQIYKGCTFISNLKKHLSLKGITQNELAEHLGIKQGSVSDWMRKDIYPTLANAVKIADFLGITLDELVLDKRPYSELEQRLIMVQEELLEYKTKEVQHLKSVKIVSE